MICKEKQLPTVGYRDADSDQQQRADTHSGVFVGIDFYLSHVPVDRSEKRCGTAALGCAQQSDDGSPLHSGRVAEMLGLIAQQPDARAQGSAPLLS
jgi:hypothetical protein